MSLTLDKDFAHWVTLDKLGKSGSSSSL